MSDIINIAPGSTVDLGLVEFSAKIDFVTFETEVNRKIELPPTAGRICWSQSSHYRRFTLHDAEPADLVALSRVPEKMSLVELEVAVDMKPQASIGAAAREQLLGELIELVARELEPSRGPFMVPQYRAFYNGPRPNPFNRMLPPRDATLYYGHRDHPVQVKSYWKKADQGVALHERDHVVRVEVSLKSAALAGLRLRTAADLLTLNYRRVLRRYFTFVRGVRRAPAGALDVSMVVSPAKLAEQDSLLWDQVGVGAFLPGGDGPVGKARFIRNIPMNRRVGEALHRLGARIAEANAAQARAPVAANDEQWRGFAYGGTV